MARKIFKRVLPAPEQFRDHPSIQVFGSLLHDPNLWHLNRRSVTVAFFVGLFVAFVPLPGQMVIAGLAAILCRANLTLSVLLVWVTNPVTMPALFFFAYKVGSVLMDLQPQDFAFELSLTWIEAELAHKWKPFLLGCAVCGLFSGLLGATTIHILWRVHVIHRWRKRQEYRRLRDQR